MKGIKSHVITLLNYCTGTLLLSVRNNNSVILYAGKLRQKFIKGAYCKMEADRIQWVRDSKKKLRIEYY